MVAELVENAQTLAMLQALGVDYTQGYYIGKPQEHMLSGPLILINNAGA
ncbi:EAL domain-containing protein [Methylophaga sp. OBS4]|nr:EAL domain-containing protein [Methylophaga sp. OBS4]MCX4187700.1 EAL domain-containing protein [Methylophaga sp. OBS4]